MKVLRRLVAWIGRLFRRGVDKASARYYEGPTPPPRLIQAAEAFAMLNPSATQEQWVRFAARHAGEAYRSGFVRGLEWKQRSPEQMEPSTAWAVIDSDERRHDWTWADLQPSPEQLRRVVHDNQEALEQLSPEERALYEDMIGQQMGTHRITLVPTDDPKQR